jgi:hypothetical protein
MIGAQRSISLISMCCAASGVARPSMISFQQSYCPSSEPPENFFNQGAGKRRDIFAHSMPLRCQVRD